MTNGSCAGRRCPFCEVCSARARRAAASVIVAAASLTVSAVVGVLWPSRSGAQEARPAIQLPNPHGRNPVFDQSRRGKTVSIEFEDLETGARMSLVDLNGDVKLINYWATWCPPCVDELPSLSVLVERFPRRSLRVVPISLDRMEAREVRDFLTKLQVSDLEFFADGSRQSGRAASVFALPTSVIVDGEGRELGRIVGSADWASSEAQSLIEGLVGPQARHITNSPTR